jgi:hypothetical protein
MSRRKKFPKKPSPKTNLFISWLVKINPLNKLSYLLFTVIAGIFTIISGLLYIHDNILHSKEIDNTAFEYGCYVSADLTNLLYFEFVKNHQGSFKFKTKLDNDEIKKQNENIIYNLDESKHLSDVLKINVDINKLLNDSHEFTTLEIATQRINNLIRERLEVSHNSHVVLIYDIGTCIGRTEKLIELADDHDYPDKPSMLTLYKDNAKTINSLSAKLNSKLRLKEDIQDLMEMSKGLHTFYNNMKSHNY